MTQPSAGQPTPPSGPDQPPASVPPTTTAGRKATNLPVWISLLALVVSVAALCLGGYALLAARDDGKPITGAPGPGGEPTAEQQPGPGPTQVVPTAGPSPTGGGVLDPRAVYAVQYDKQVLTLSPPSSCYEELYVDLDEPRVGVASGLADAEVFSGCNGPPTVSFYSTESAEVTSPATTPNECAERFRVAPLAADKQVPLNRGVVLCTSTRRSDAERQGFPRRIILIEVTAVGADGKINVTVSAWNSPN